MKKNTLRVGILIVLSIAFAILMPKSTFATTINSIEITVPEPVIGETLTTDNSKIQIKDGENHKFEVNEISWYSDKLNAQGQYLNNYEKITDLNQTCNRRDKYQLQLEFLFPIDSYTYSGNESVMFNGKILEKDTDYVLAEKIINDITYQATLITYNFEQAKVQKEISKIEITTPTPIVGEKLNTDISNYQVKIDDTEMLSVDSVKWLSEDYQELSSDIAEEGKKYTSCVDFKVPNKYGMSSNVIITVNGEKVYFENMASNEFNYATSGENDFDDASVSKLMEAKTVVKEETKTEIEGTKTEEAKEENKAEEVTNNQSTLKNPKTGDTIATTFIILGVSILGLAFTINSIKKQNK